MNICYFGHGLQDVGGGSSQYFTLLAEKMADLGHTITVVSSGQRRNDLHSKIKFVPLGNGDSKLQKYAMFPVKALSFFARYKDIDLIHAGSSYSHFAYLAKFVSVISQKPIVYSVFSEASLPRNISFDRLIITSKRLMKRYRNMGAYVPTFIDTTKFCVNNMYNFRNTNGFVVGTLGTPLARRGHVTLLKAISLVLQKYPNVLFVLAIALFPQIKRKDERIGFEAIKDFIRKNKLDNNVRIIGEVDVSKFFNSIDVFIYPLKTAVGAMDITPTILECLASGCCLITPKVGSIPEVIKDGYNGILVDSQNPREYADKIIKLIGNRSFYCRIKRNARKNLEQFDINRIALMISKVYEEARRI